MQSPPDHSFAAKALKGSKSYRNHQILIQGILTLRSNLTKLSPESQAVIGSSNQQVIAASLGLHFLENALFFDSCQPSTVGGAVFGRSRSQTKAKIKM
jgi:hypothetical protein